MVKKDKLTRRKIKQNKEEQNRKEQNDEEVNSPYVPPEEEINVHNIDIETVPERTLNNINISISVKNDIIKKCRLLDEYITTNLSFSEWLSNDYIPYSILFRDMSYIINQYNLELCETYMSYCTQYFLNGTVPIEDTQMIFDYHNKYIYCNI